MPTPINMPRLDQVTEQASITKWLKKEGDTVSKGDILFVVETDKAALEVESFEEGTLLKILVQQDVPVQVSTPVGFIGAPGEAIPDVAAAAPAIAPKPAPPPVATPARGSGQTSSPPPPRPANVPPVAPVASPPPPTVPAENAPPLRISPRAAALARTAVIDPARITGSGPEGRIVEKDVKAHLDANGYDRLRITPTAKALASREKIDILTMTPSGASGRITVEDVNRAIRERPVPMSKMRQAIAQRLTQSFRDIPHIFITVAVDMTDLVDYRAELKAAGVSLSVNDFVSAAVVLALEEFPQFNSSTDGKSVRWNRHVNLGIAVALDNGLVVPVVTAAEQLSVRELAAQARELVGRARAGKAKPHELSGGTFTISNLGMMDVENFTAIINPGEGAILAVASVVPQAVVRNGAIAIRQMMKMTVSCDHRLVDGALGAQFANTIKRKLEDVQLWKLLVN